MKYADHIIHSLTFISADRQNSEETKAKRRNPASVMSLKNALLGWKHPHYHHLQ